MHLLLESVVKDPDGVFSISLWVMNDNAKPKRYTYRLASEYIVRRFQAYYKKGNGLHRTALAVLNKHKMLGKEKENEKLCG